MKRAIWAVLAAIIGSASCAEEKSGYGEDLGPTQAADLGTLSLHLTGFDDAGRQYWLRGAEFVVEPSAPDGSPSITLTTDEDPTQDMLAASLLPGPYSVTLGGDWYLEYQTPGGLQRAERVSLISQAQQEATVSEGQITEVVFRFAIGEGTGDLVIGIDVERRGDAAVGGPRDGGAGGSDAGVGTRPDGGLDGGSELDAGPGAQGPDGGADRDGGVDDEDDAGAGDAGSRDAASPSIDSGLTYYPTPRSTLRRAA